MKLLIKIKIKRYRIYLMRNLDIIPPNNSILSIRKKYPLLQINVPEPNKSFFLGSRNFNPNQKIYPLDILLQIFSKIILILCQFKISDEFFLLFHSKYTSPIFQIINLQYSLQIYLILDFQITNLYFKFSVTQFNQIMHQQTVIYQNFFAKYHLNYQYIL